MGFGILFLKVCVYFISIGLITILVRRRCYDDNCLWLYFNFCFNIFDSVVKVTGISLTKNLPEKKC